MLSVIYNEDAEQIDFLIESCNCTNFDPFSGLDVLETEPFVN